MLHVHSLESFGSVDGPGIRFVIFLKGCRMRCRYCHNPDTWAPGAKGGEAMTVGQLLDKAERYRAYWGKEGGITVSGGEALLQIDGLIELFEEAHRRGINTCLDTAAQPFTREEPFYGKFLRLMQSADTVLLDLKHLDSEAHKNSRDGATRTFSTAHAASPTSACLCGSVMSLCRASPTMGIICAACGRSSTP